MKDDEKQDDEEEEEEDSFHAFIKKQVAKITEDDGVKVKQEPKEDDMKPIDIKVE